MASCWTLLVDSAFGFFCIAPKENVNDESVDKRSYFIFMAAIFFTVKSFSQSALSLCLYYV